MAVSFHIDLPEWDPYAGGMKSIWNNSVDFPREWKSDECSGFHDIPDTFIRPTDFDLWRKNLIVHECNHDQWHAALRAMENDPDLWIFVSY